MVCCVYNAHRGSSMGANKNRIPVTGMLKWRGPCCQSWCMQSLRFPPVLSSASCQIHIMRGRRAFSLENLFFCYGRNVVLIEKPAVNGFIRIGLSIREDHSCSENLDLRRKQQEDLENYVMIFVICDVHQKLRWEGCAGHITRKINVETWQQVSAWVVEVSGGRIVLGNLSFWTSGHGTDRLSRNVRTDLPLYDV